MTKGAWLLLAVLGALPSGIAGATVDETAPPEQGPPSSEQDDRININEAGSGELVRLPGVGPARAQAIVRERQRRRFRRIEDILRVPGIGRKTFDRIRHLIRVR